MILLIDNYDSFVHNLARYLRKLGQSTLVVRNDQIDVQGVRRLSPAAIVLSPGPCTPQQTGCCIELVAKLYRTVPMLGVCLGHQVIAEAFGGRVVRAAQAMHGMTAPVHHDGHPLFAGLPSPFQAGRYHSLEVAAEQLPRELIPIARADDLPVMAVSHVEFPVAGVQFHPESILTESGFRILRNFFVWAGLPCDRCPRFDDELVLQNGS